MDFQPINRDHAVQSITFTVAFDQAVPSSAIQSLRARQDLLAELPAVQTPEAFEVMVAGPTPVPRRLGGIQLSHLRPDGTPAWALRLMANELAVECTRYTRWDSVWISAKKYLEAGLQAANSVVKPGRPRRVMVVGLNVIDTFLAERKECNLSTLLKSGDLVAAKIFAQDSMWHSHIGWFEALDKPNNAWLNQLNIDAVKGSVPGAPAEQLRVQITHNQEFRFLEAAAIDEIASNLDSRMVSLHRYNKRILGQLLTDEAANRIGLKEDLRELAV